MGSIVKAKTARPQLHKLARSKGACPNGCIVTRGNNLKTQIAASRYCFKNGWCPWVRYSSQKVQVLSGAGMCLRPRSSI